MCATCLSGYVNHCCECWATENTIPIKCQVPQCRSLLPEAQVRALLTSELLAPQGLWDKYSRTQLKVALADAQKQATEVPVTCAFCGNYSEFYVKVAPDYWQHAEKERFQAQAAKEQAIYEATKRLQEEMERKLQEAEKKGDEEGKDEDELKMEGNDAAVAHMEEVFGRGQRKVNDFRAVFGEPNWENDFNVPVSHPELKYQESEVDLLCNFSMNENLDPDVWRLMKVQLEEQLTLLREKITKDSAEANVLREKVLRQREERRAKLKAELEARRKEMVEQITAEIEEKMQSEQKSSKEDVMTSQFFVCRNLFCDGAFCLKCESFLKKQVLSYHFCSTDPVEKLYSRVVETLATGSSRSCPNCGTSGMKDLNCTHITCDKCSQRFCYVCGTAESKLEGGFDGHNDWDIHNPQPNKCPMYLHYKYGNGEDPAQALDSFHRELQISAIAKLKEEVKDDKLWEEMEEKKFNKQPIVAAPDLVDPAHVAANHNPLHEGIDFLGGWQPNPRRERLDRFIDKLLIADAVIFGFYCLFFLAMYCWMIHEGKTNSSSQCSQSSLSTFAIIQGSLGWGLLMYSIIGLCGIGFDNNFTVYAALCMGGANFVAMFGTFVWGAVMFYKTSSSTCVYALWQCLNVYFNGTWYGSGLLVLLAAITMTLMCISDHMH
eukprot:TRINITY_DN11649_c0_g1_i2.p1 TRINITY_DN11649_c0_g1~~TRINITY_DN11649_c0_g1_i2.p1  ORF type:complete len:735 (-),score=139.40 TRINITY_DN11649_c0_g1_i2:2496-4478(-)